MGSPVSCVNEFIEAPAVFRLIGLGLAVWGFGCEPSPYGIAVRAAFLAYFLVGCSLESKLNRLFYNVCWVGQV